MGKTIQQLNSLDESTITSDSLLLVTGEDGQSYKITLEDLIKAVVGDGTISNVKLKTGAGEPGGVWTAWVPTFTNLSIGNGTLSASYTQIGKTVIARLNLLFGSTTSISGNVSLTPPVTPKANYGTQKYQPLGRALYTDEGSNVYAGTPYFQNSVTAISLGTLGAASTYVNASNVVINGTIPFTWANTDAISLEIIYEAA